MKTANFGLNYKVLGSLQGVAAFALVTVLALSGPAYAQIPAIDLSAVIEADATYEPGENVNVTITIDRTDSDPALDDQVTAVGGELTLPADWTLAIDADDNCVPVLQSGETALDNQVQNTNARVQFKRNQSLFNDPPNNTICTPVPDTGNLLEFFWLDAQANNPLPVAFPIVLKIVLTTPGNGTGDQNLGAEIKYRVSTGPEETTDSNVATVEIGVVGGCTNVGDADGNTFVDIDDVQALFDFVAEAPGASVNVECSNFCLNGEVDIDDVQGLFNFVAEAPEPFCDGGVPSAL